MKNSVPADYYKEIFETIGLSVTFGSLQQIDCLKIAGYNTYAEVYQFLLQSRHLPGS